MFRFSLAIWLLCVVSSLQGQQLRLAYFGETLTHYGLRTGVEFTIKHTEKAQKQGGIATHSLLGSANLSIYRHPNNHIGAALSPELGWRRTGKGGGVLQAAVSAGVFRSFYEADTREMSENGSFEKVPLAGQWGFLPGVSLGLGHDFSVKSKAPFLLFANIHYMQQHPYNTSFLHKAAIEAGIVFKKF